MELTSEMIYSKNPIINIDRNKCYYNYNCVDAVMNKEDFYLLNAYSGYYLELMNRLNNKKYINPLAEIQDRINK